MSGRPKLKLYHYDNEYKYIKTFETQMQVFNEYFDGKKGQLFNNPDFRKLPDGTFVSPYRVGRDKLRKVIKIANDPLCAKNAKDKPIIFYNRKMEQIASFNCIRTACQLTGKSYSSIQVGLEAAWHGSDGILIREDKQKEHDTRSI